MNHETYLIQAKAMDEECVKYIERLSKIPEMAKDSQFKATVALIFILTWCTDAQDEADGCNPLGRSKDGQGQGGKETSKRAQEVAQSENGRQQEVKKKIIEIASYHKRIVDVFELLTEVKGQVHDFTRPIFRTPLSGESQERNEMQQEEATSVEVQHKEMEDVEMQQEKFQNAEMHQEEIKQEATQHEEVQPGATQPQGYKMERHSLWELVADRVLAEVPMAYARNVTSAFLFLLLTDASSSFSALGIADRTSELPCLLETIQNSSKNNIKKLDALLGEYLALIRICLDKEFSSFHSYVTKTVTYDFALKSDVKKHRVSVKSVCFAGVTCFENPKKFKEDEQGQSKKNKRKREEKKLSFASDKDDLNILLHNYPCKFYHRQPMCKVQVKTVSKKRMIKGQWCTDCNGDCEKKFKEILSDLNNGVVYLASAKQFYELRYGLCTFDQEIFRSGKFKLRKLLCEFLMKTFPTLPDGAARAESDKWMPTLIDRSVPTAKETAAAT